MIGWHAKTTTSLSGHLWSLYLQNEGKGCFLFPPVQGRAQNAGPQPFAPGPRRVLPFNPQGFFCLPMMWGMFRAKEKPVPAHCFQIVQPKDKITEPWPSEPEIPGAAMLKAHLTFSEKREHISQLTLKIDSSIFQSQLPRFAATKAVLGQRNPKPEVMNLANAQRLGDFMARASSNRRAAS